jgi:TatD DNase family protein
MLIDTHCHLDAAEFDADRDDAVARARHAGIGRIVVPAVDAGNFATVRALAARHPGTVRFALGIHPLFVDRSSDDDLLRLRDEVAASLDDPRFVGIGEIGLDHFVEGLDRDRQERFLAEQLRIARDFDLPVILHVRRAQDGVLKQLRRFRPRGGIAHAFNGSLQQARTFVELGCALGFGGAMTFARALQIRRLAQAMPIEACVLETDAPDIPPAWIRAGRNAPHELAGIALAFAELRGIEPAEAIGASGRAARRVLPRLETTVG